jgi:hypothetical protein
MTEAASAAEVPQRPRKRRFHKAWNTFSTQSVQATRYVRGKVVNLARWASSLTRRGGSATARATSTVAHAVRTVTVRTAILMWSVLVSLLGFALDVVAAILLVAVAIFLGLIAGLVMIGTAVYMHGRDIGTATRTAFRRTSEPEAPAETEIVEEAPGTVELPMVEILDRKAVLAAALESTPTDPALLGQQAFLDFLTSHPWAVLPDEERKAWAAVSKGFRNGTKTAVRKGFVAERDLWVSNLGLANHQAA